MAERPVQMGEMADERLEEALRAIGRSLAYPAADGGGGSARDIAATVSARIEASGPPRRGMQSWLPGPRPLRRSLVLALAALLILAAVAAAIGLGLPGLRITIGTVPSIPPASAPSPSPLGPIGATLGLGSHVTIEEAARLAGFEIALPADPAIGPPDAAFVNRGRVALVWAARPGLPGGPDGIGLLISEFEGRVDAGYYEKVVDSGGRVEPVTVGGGRGYWIAGAPHFFIYIDEDGEPVDDSRRLVGDTLTWTDGDLTYRIEAAVGRDASIGLAESLR